MATFWDPKLRAKYKRPLQAEHPDIQLAIQRKDPKGDPVEEAVKERRRQSQPTLFYNLPGRSNRSYVDHAEYAPEIKPVYDLAECIKLLDTESYFAVSVDRHVELIMKEGYYFEGANPDAVAYVEKRCSEIAMISDQPFTDMCRELVRNTVTTANGIIVLKRDSSRSSGRRIRLWGRELDPISAVYLADPSSVAVRQNKTGRPYQWVQTIEGDKKYWPHHDVIHIPLRKKTGFLFGTPYVIPVLEDIRALRKLEMMAEHVAHKFAFPLMHWKVGTPEIPADMIIDPETGQQFPEVRVAENVARLMAQEGFAVTSERHEIKLIGAEGEKIDLQPLITYYEQRVFAGLRVSALDVGRGDSANKATAKSLSQILIDGCIEIQRIIEEYLNFKLINIILMEGGFELNPENQVSFKFPPIDKEEERASETHGMNLYGTGSITHDELRQEYLGRNCCSEEDDKGMILNKQLIPLAEATAEAKAAAKPPSSTKAASSVHSIMQPTNQYGTMQTKPKIAANDAIFQIWIDAAQGIIDKVSDSGNTDDVRPIYNLALQQIVKQMNRPVTEAWEKGYKDALRQSGKTPADPTDTKNLATLTQFIRNKDLQSLVRTCMLSAGLSLKTGQRDFESTLSVTAAFEATKPLLQLKTEQAIDTAEKVGFLDGLHKVGASEVLCVYREGHSEKLNLSEPGLIHTAGNPTVERFEVVNG